MSPVPPMIRAMDIGGFEYPELKVSVMVGWGPGFVPAVRVIENPVCVPELTVRLSLPAFAGLGFSRTVAEFVRPISRLSYLESLGAQSAPRAMTALRAFTILPQVSRNRCVLIS
jgi:hypothetical protein